MKILQVHNYYRMPGGEDTVVVAEKKMLEQKGHQVHTYYRHNAELDDYSVLKKWRLIKSTTWNDESYSQIRHIIQKFRPDVCHVHNFLPLISPSVSAACKDESVPLVQTLHNYRLMCTNGLLMRNNQVCEACLGASAYRSVTKKCYRKSHIQTYAVARMLENTDWHAYADAYLCFTPFMKQKYVAHGLPAEKIHIKPNFVESVSVTKDQEKGGYLVYVGRLDENKGVRLFREIAKQLPIPLKIVGGGVLSNELRGIENIELLGSKPATETRQLIRGAQALLFPSRSYEGMPMTILEAFVEKTPVIASRMGAMEAMITHGQNGLLFEPGNAAELLEKVNFAWQNDAEMEALGNRAYQDVEAYYSKDKNYDLLVKVYEQAIG